MKAKLSSRLPKIVASSGALAAVAVREAGEAIERGAKERVAVDSGDLRDSIRWTPHGPYEGEVVVGEFYGSFVEFGTVRRPARPYMVPAAEEARPGFVRAMRAAYR